ncbi:MAG TPA: hypothetical protein VGM88_29640 [Kofleriaceae bacterium]
MMATLAPVLEKYGYVAKPDALVKIFGERNSRPGQADPRYSGPQFAADVEVGVNAYVDLEYERAAKLLDAAIMRARENPIVLAREPQYRDAMLRGLLYYALANGRRADDANRAVATEAAAARDDAMAELIRSFPTKVILRKDYGQEAEQLYAKMRKQLDGAGRGRIEIGADAADTVIYVDETVRGQHAATIADLVPGHYRVLAQFQGGESRQYDVEVLANQASRVVVDSELDPTLTVADWVGFRFANDADRAAQEGRLVSKLVRSNTADLIAATFTIVAENHRITVIGSMYAAATGHFVRAGMIELVNDHDREGLDQLAAYLERRVAPRVKPLNR